MSHTSSDVPVLAFSQTIGLGAQVSALADEIGTIAATPATNNPSTTTHALRFALRLRSNRVTNEPSIDMTAPFPLRICRARTPYGDDPDYDYVTAIHERVTASI
ncbi:hypothetical protein GCM10023322_21270 [Rugosimonospora acidiphila]|uniref:Uncharacterized protein n=1 Tax=Rugosimonospora acidiphila TaxID=556531 RepID=A0ABP9RPT0_9ACTN